MKLVSFTVTKYRSITNAHKIPIARQAVLVGPNNEGKSNLLRALATAMRVLVAARSEAFGTQSGRLIRFHRDSYEWERDFPLTLQKTQPTGRSEITLEFELTPDEVQEFKRDVRSTLNGTLPIRIALGQRDFDIKVVKRGRGGPALTAKSTKIARFVSTRVNFEQIPAVRTAASAERIVSEMVERELRPLETDPEYVSALNAIVKLQQPVLDRLSSSIRTTLVQFLPDIIDVQVLIPAEARYSALRRSCEIVVNDGTATPLKHKGDGVQSLAALGIMRQASESSAIGRNLVIAIEEPESHLHPGAIHELKAVLRELSEKHQLVVTAHNPLFVDRGHLRTNIIVKDSRARPAQNIEELRDAIGVRASDNLRHAELVLVVEGEDDRVAVTALLRHLSAKCRQAIDGGLLALDTLGGATNLGYKLGLLRAALCKTHCFLDHDEAGRAAFERAHAESLIADADVNWAICDGMKDSEIEDMFEPNVYASALLDNFRVALQAPEFRSAKKWSERVGRTFRRNGKAWDDRVERDVKRIVAACIAADPEHALMAAKKSAFDSLIETLEQRLSEPPEQA